MELIPNRMLISIVDSILDDKKSISTIVKAYSDNSLRQGDYLFYQDKLTTNSLVRGLILLKDLFYLQVILNKNFYFPWIWLFAIEPIDFIQGYSFPATFLSRINLDQEHLDRIIVDGKIDLANARKTKVNTKSYKWYMKIKKINKLLMNYSDHDIKVVLKEEYKWKNDFFDVYKDYKKHPENIFNYLTDVLYDESIIYNVKLLEDILMIIWYVKNDLKINYKLSDLC